MRRFTSVFQSGSPILWLKIDFLQKDIDLNIPSETSPFCENLKEKHIKLNVWDGKFETP